MLVLVANENIPRQLVASLRERDHDVRWILEEYREISDPEVLTEAIQQRRVLLTSDKDFEFWALDSADKHQDHQNAGSSHAEML